MDYVVTGMRMIDVSVYGDSRRETQIGGIPLYGYCGIAPYTDSIDFVARVGKDFFSYYNPWFSQNNIRSTSNSSLSSIIRTLFLYDCLFSDFLNKGRLGLQISHIPLAWKMFLLKTSRRKQIQRSLLSLFSLFPQERQTLLFLTCCNHPLYYLQM